MKLYVRDDKGRAQLMLVHGQNVLGMAHLTWAQYEHTLRQMLHAFDVLAKETLAKKLAEHLWRDAQTLVEGASAELAKEKLLAFGWSQEKIDAYALELTRALKSELTKLLPEHR